MIRRTALTLVLFAASACERQPTAPVSPAALPGGRAAVENNGPPEPRSFGPDTRTTEGPYTGQAIANPTLVCDASTSARRFDGYLASGVDGTMLDATLQLPDGSGPFPLVVLLHGWAGSKGTSSDIADRFVGDGYAVLRYSARGFGNSWGRVNLADIDVELSDLRSMIGGVVDQANCATQPDAVAVTGASYGGGQSWLAALTPTFTTNGGANVRIRTVVPIVPWSDLLYSLIPNGRPRNSIDGIGGLKLSYVNGFYVSGLRSPDEGPQPYYVNYPDYLVTWHAWLNATEPTAGDPVMQQIVDGIAGYRSIWWQDAFWRTVATNRIPVFQIQGLTDDLFPLDEAKRMLLALKSLDPTYPIASYFGDLGHPRASNKPGEVDYVLTLIEQWLAYYLTGVGSQPAFDIRAAITRPRDEPFDPTDVFSVAAWPDVSTATVEESFPQTAVLVNPVSDPLASFFWDPLVMEGAEQLQPYLQTPPPSATVPGSLASYEVPVGRLGRGSPLLIAGQPSVTFHVVTTSPRVQLDVRLFDIAPRGEQQLITRGTYTLDTGTGLPLSGSDITIPTYGNVWSASVNHRIRLEISNLDSPYISPSKTPSVSEISNVRLAIPIR